MEIKYKKVIHISGVGTFEKVDEWNGISKYSGIGIDQIFMSYDGNDWIENMFSFNNEDGKINIIMASPDLLKLLKESSNE